MKQLRFTCGFAKCFFAVLFLLAVPVLADCIAPLHCNSEIREDRLIVSCREGSDIAFTDTITIDEQVAALKQEIDSVVYCFQGRIDSIIPYRTPPDGGDPCISYLVDSVHVNVITTYKGAVSGDYWFIDTITPGYCDTTKAVWIEDGDPGYEKILHRYRFIAFTNKAGTLRRSNVKTGACGFRSGYYIDTINNMVYKAGLEELNAEDSYLYIDSYTRWIKMPLTDFINTLGSVAAVRAPEHSVADGEAFTLVRQSGGYHIISRKKQQLYLTRYGLNGRVFMEQSVNCREGEHIHLPGNGIHTPGVWLFGISDGKTVHAFRLAAW